MKTTMAVMPKWFIIVAYIAIGWNILGVMVFISQITMSAETLATLPAEQRKLYETIPLWANCAFAVAVFGGTLASIAMLLGKKVAKLLFFVSFIGILVQMFQALILADTWNVLGPVGFIMPSLVIIIGIVLLWFSSAAQAKGWLS